MALFRKVFRHRNKINLRIKKSGFWPNGYAQNPRRGGLALYQIGLRRYAWLCAEIGDVLRLRQSGAGE